MKNRKCTSPNITPPEKAFKYTKALLSQLVQVLALIIVCSGNDSDIKDLSRFSEISIVLSTKGILFYTFSFPLHMFHCAVISSFHVTHKESKF